MRSDLTHGGGDAVTLMVFRDAGPQAGHRDCARATQCGGADQRQDCRWRCGQGAHGPCEGPEPGRMLRFFPGPLPAGSRIRQVRCQMIHPPARDKVHLGLKPFAVYSRWRSLEISSCFLVGAHEYRMITSRYLLIFRGVDY